tara:strand:+ start:1791 stop:2006 length:216 start_codon:yes stop_codon:yes gene_type:complete
MKIHHQWMPNQLIYKNDLISSDTKSKLENIGHILKGRKNLDRLMRILFPNNSNVYIGVSDSSSPEDGAVGN